MEETTPIKTQHQKSYPVDFKLKVLDWYYSNGKNKLKTATHFNIHTKRIRDWELNEAFLRAHSDSPRRRFRMEKASADTYGNIGKNLYQWYVEEKARGTEHSFGDLKTKAVQLATELNVQDSFTVSDSWIRRWKKKYGVEDGKRRSSAAAVREEGVVEVETGAGNCMDTGEHGDIITLPAIVQVQTDGVGESIVYVSEPQPMAHTAEEVIDMVENPVTSEVLVNEGGLVGQNLTIASVSSLPTIASITTASVPAPEPVEVQTQSITLGPTLLEHLLISLNETKKKLDHQEELTRQAVHRAEEAEKGVSECKSRITMLELAMQQLRGSVGQMMLEETVVPLVVNSLPLPITSVSEVILPAATQVTEVTLPAATPALPIVTAITDTHTS